MELPDVGTQCSEADCRQLDFLPTKCDGCRKIFCNDHYAFAAHKCPNPPRDAQAAVCPMCGVVVPGRPDEDPNIRMNEHISRGCGPSAPPPTSSVPKSAICSLPSCREKTLVPTTCRECQRQFCLKHRLEADHACTGPPPKGVPAKKMTFFGKPDDAKHEAAKEALKDANKQRQMEAHAKWQQQQQQGGQKQGQKQGQSQGQGQKKDSCNIQ